MLAASSSFLTDTSCSGSRAEVLARLTQQLRSTPPTQLSASRLQRATARSSAPTPRSRALMALLPHRVASARLLTATSRIPAPASSMRRRQLRAQRSKLYTPPLTTWHFRSSGLLIDWRLWLRGVVDTGTSTRHLRYHDWTRLATVSLQTQMCIWDMMFTPDNPHG